MSSRRQKWNGVGAVLIVGSVLAGYFLITGSNPSTYEFLVEPECDLHKGGCRAVSGQGASIELAIYPREIPLLERLEVNVVLKGIEASSVAVVFTGVDVDMGTLVYPLDSSGDGLFSGRASLSVCSQRRMTWQAAVVVEAEGVRYEVPFYFDTEYRSKFDFI